MPYTHYIGHRYELLEKIGHGGMGTVYRAHDRMNGSIVALKRLSISADRVMFMSRPSTGAGRGTLTARDRGIAQELVQQGYSSAAPFK